MGEVVSAELPLLKQGEKLFSGLGIVLIVGQHGVTEEVGTRAAERLRNSELGKKFAIDIVSFPEGYDYTDAYRAAKRREVAGEDLVEAFTDEEERRFTEGMDAVFELAKQHPEKLFINVHCTPGDFGNLETSVREGIEYNVLFYSLAGDFRSKTKAIHNNRRLITELENELKGALPKSDPQLVNVVSPFHSWKFQADYPQNLVIVELYIDYRGIADEVAPEIAGEDGGLLVPKRVVDYKNDDKIILMQKREREIAKGNRLLRLTLPILADFYVSKGVISA